MKTVNILGTEYKIEIHSMDEDEVLSRNSWAAYTRDNEHVIVLTDLDNCNVNFSSENGKDNYAKETLRHEIIHAFLNESGLKDNSMTNGEMPWAKNEEMVDWIAIQFPKILKAYEEVGAL